MSDFPLIPFDINYYYYFFIYIAVALIIFIMKLFFQEFFKGRQQKTKRNEFVKFLRYNKSVNHYIRQYEKIFFFERKWAIIYLYIGMLGFTIPFFFMYIIYHCLNLEDRLTNTHSLRIISLSIGITLWLTLIYIQYINKSIDSIINEDKFFEKYLSVANKFTLIEYNVIFSYLSILFLFFIAFISILNEKINMDLLIVFMLIFDIVLFLGIPLLVINEK